MRYTTITSCVLPHSEISGSKLICSSPKLIAACHVLHRLLMPRHSPCALISFTYTVFDLQHGSLRIMQVQQKLFNKIVSLPFVRENFTPFRPSLARRTSISYRFLFLSNSNPLALGFEFVSGSQELCRLNRIFTQNCIYP